MVKTSLVFAQASKEDWFQKALMVYEEKIGHMIPFEVKAIKSDKFSRKDRNKKIIAEEKQFLKQITAQDQVLIFDERGRSFSDSRQFSSYLVKKLELSRCLVFMISGAYGLGSKLRGRADELISLSRLTMNHQVATIVVLEQLYRALTIWKGLPYHND